MPNYGGLDQSNVGILLGKIPLIPGGQASKIAGFLLGGHQLDFEMFHLLDHMFKDQSMVFDGISDLIVEPVSFKCSWLNERNSDQIHRILV